MIHFLIICSDQHYSRKSIIPSKQSPIYFLTTIVSYPHPSTHPFPTIHNWPLYYIWFVFNSSLKSSIHLIIFPQKNGILQQPNAIWNHSHLYSFYDNQLSHLKTVTLPPLSFSHRYPSLKLNNDGSKQAHHFKYPSLITMLGCLFCTIYGELFAKFTNER